MTGIDKRISLIRKYCQAALTDYTRFGGECFAEDTSGYRCITLSLLQIGECASGLPKEFRAKHNEMPWDKIIGLRHRLVHDYEHIRQDILKIIVQQDIPELNNWCGNFLKDQSAQPTSVFDNL